MHLVSLFSYSPHVLLVVAAVIPQMVEPDYDFDVFGKGLELGSYHVTHAMCQVCKCKLLDTYIIGTMREVQLFQFPSAPNCYNFLYCLCFLSLRTLPSRSIICKSFPIFHLLSLVKVL